MQRCEIQYPSVVYCEANNELFQHILSDLHGYACNLHVVYVHCKIQLMSALKKKCSYRSICNIYPVLLMASSNQFLGEQIMIIGLHLL